MVRGDITRLKASSGVRRLVGHSHLSRACTLGIVVLALLTCGLLVYLQVSPHFGEHVDSSFLLLPLSSSWYALALLVAVGLLTEKYAIKLGSGMEVSAAFLAYFLSGALIGPLAGLIVAVISQLPMIRRNGVERTAINASAVGIVSAATGLFYIATLNWFEGPGRASPIVVAAVGLAAGVLFQALNYIVYLPIAWVRRRVGPIPMWREGFQPFLAFHFFFLAISLGLIYIYRLYAFQGVDSSSIYSTLLVMLCLLPVLGLIYAFRAYALQRQLAQHNERLALRNERLFLQAVKSQVTALDVKDNYTARHSAAVARWATDIAESMALSKHQQNVAHLASLVHDVGKIGVPDEVLNYPGRVDQQGWSLIETHCQNGHKILKTIDQFDELADVILYHHERYDGLGYPVGVAGEEIPLLSRVICVADSYSAMVSDRPYRKALSVDAARAELVRHSGKQFDPVVVDHFLGILAARDYCYQRGEQADFDLEFSSDRFLRELPPDAPVEEEPGLAASLAKS